MKRKIFFSLIVTTVFFCVAEVLAKSIVTPTGAMVQVHSGQSARTTWLSKRGNQVSAAYQHRSTGSFPAQMMRPRIAVLGGSSVHGGSNGVSQRQEFPAIIGKRLGIQTLNLGNPSLDSHDLLSILEELQKYPMSAWIVYTGHNDFGNTYFHQRYRGWSGTLGAYIEVWMSRLALFQLVRALLSKPSGNTSKPNPKKQFSGPHISHAQKIRALGYFQSNIERMIWLAQQSGTPIVFVVPIRDIQRAPLGGCHESPCANDLYDQGIALREANPKQAAIQLKKAADADEIPLRVITQAQDFLRSLSQDGVYVVDAPMMLAPSEIVPSEIFQDHVHLTVRGHQQLADVIATAIKKTEIRIQR